MKFNVSLQNFILKYFHKTKFFIWLIQQLFSQITLLKIHLLNIMQQNLMLLIIIKIHHQYQNFFK